MDIKADIERIRDLAGVLQNWDEIVKEKRLDAIWGCNCGFNNIKVQNTLQIDRGENAILKVQELEEYRDELFAQYWNEKQIIMQLIERHAKIEDQTLLHRYLIGCELSKIPLTGRQKNPQNVVNGAIRRLQGNLDRE